jgi:hypothetical protein
VCPDEPLLKVWCAMGKKKKLWNTALHHEAHQYPQQNPLCHVLTFQQIYFNMTDNNSSSFTSKCKWGTTEAQYFQIFVSAN